MPTEIKILAWAAVLLIVHIFAAVHLKTRQYGAKWNMGARDEAQPPLNPLAGRLQRGRRGREPHEREHRARRLDLARRAHRLPAALCGGHSGDPDSCLCGKSRGSRDGAEAVVRRLSHVVTAPVTG